jgi:hypothetical protein
MAQEITATLRVYNASSTFVCEFPAFTALNVQDTFDDVGSFTLSFPKNGVNAGNLISNTDLQIAACIDYADGNGYTEVWRGLYEQDNYDVSMPESAVIQANGRSMVAMLDSAVVYPSGGVGTVPAYTSFSSASPGKIMHDLIVAAQARGCFPSLAMSFTSGQDSSGNAWSQSYTYSYSIGTSYLSVLTGLAAAGLVDFSMTGTTLNLYNAGTTLAADLSTTVYLRRGRDIIDLPTARDRTQIGTSVLVGGDNGLTVERKNVTQIGLLGRKEKYLAQSGVNDTGTLNFWGDQLVGAIDDQQTSYAADIVFNKRSGTSPMPWKDYKPGNYISTDLTGTPVKVQARQFTMQLTAGGPLFGQLTMNDLFYAQEVLLNGKLQAISGSVTGATSIATLPGPNATIPNPPAFVSANVYTSAYYSPATGTTVAQIQLNWTTPTNTDGTPVNDGQSYLVQYQVSTTPLFPLHWSQIVGKPWSAVVGNPWSNPLATPFNTQWHTVTVPFDQNSCTITGLICGETYNFQIATTDVSGNTSAFSATSAFLTASDNVAPSTPDAPTVSASMVAVQVMHDLGKASGGTYNLEQDLDHLEVHYSYEPSFTPVPGVGSVTYLGKLIANAGMMAAQIAAVGTFQVTNTTGVYIKVLAVDESGNYGAASAASGVTAVLIDDSHISSLSVSKLIAGTILATIILGGTIATALSGQRVQMDLNGFHAYDASNNKIFDVSASSPVLTLGQNGVSGHSITMDTSQTYPTINFKVIGSTASAYINAVNLANNTTGIGINMGPYASAIDGSAVTQQIFLDGVAGFQFNTYDASLAPHGYTFTVQDTGALLVSYNHGNPIPGGVFLETNVGFTDTALTLEGYTSTFSVDNASFVVYTANSFGAGGGTFAISYGVTMMSAMAPLVQYSCSNTSVTPALNISANSTTGYSITMSAAAPASFSIFTSSFRRV